VLAPQTAFIAVALFVLGLLSMLAGMISALLELKTAIQPAELESRFVSEMLHQDALREDALRAGDATGVRRFDDTV